MSTYPRERVAAAVERACRECNLDDTHIGAVWAYVEDDEDAWPPCCGSACEPCVQSLADAARRALAILERG